MCALGLILKAERIHPHPENLQVAKLSTTTSRTSRNPGSPLLSSTQTSINVSISRKNIHQT